MASTSGIVHRIDKDTSGLLIVAKIIAHQRLSEAFSKHEVKRIYTALVYGKIDVPKVLSICPSVDTVRTD